MKKYIVLALMIFTLPYGSVADSRIRQVSPAVYADLEVPFRCVASGSDRQISHTIVLTPDDFSFLPFRSGDVLPRYAVNGYSFHDKPVNKAIEELVCQLGIKVVAPHTEYPYLDAKDVKGELSSVIAQLAEAGDVFYSYKASTQTLTLLRRDEYVLTVPKYKPVLMAVLDALRGTGIQNLTTDWEKYRIHMTVSTEELQKAQQLVRQILDDSYLLAADIESYQAIPYPQHGEWQTVVSKAVDLVASIGRSVVGRAIVLKTQVSTDAFLKKVKSEFQLQPLVSGQTVVPNGWQMRFNMSECFNNALPYPDMSVVMKTKIKDQDREQTAVTLSTADGVLSTFNVSSGLNQDIALVGIPTKHGNTQLVFVLRFNLVRFIQKGE